MGFAHLFGLLVSRPCGDWFVSRMLFSGSHEPPALAIIPRSCKARISVAVTGVRGDLSTKHTIGGDEIQRGQRHADYPPDQSHM